MPDLASALRTILEHSATLPGEEVPALSALGRVLAADVLMPCDLPRFDNSAMDGFAVRAADCAGPAARLEVIDTVHAGGAARRAVGPGQAVRIMTGAPMPEGADTIVQVEHTRDLGGHVELEGPLRPGAHVRRHGEDLRAGQVAVRAGAVLGPTEMTLLATAGRLTVPVVRRARVAILSTGDELVEPGTPAGPGRIPDSNGLGLAAAVLAIGAEPVPLGIARDEPDALREKLTRGFDADVLVTSAGVSVGGHDYVREVLAERGVERLFWKVDVKPGRPTTFGRRGETLVFSLPGNPVSTLLMFDLLVRPAVLRRMGHRRVGRPFVTARLTAPTGLSAGRVTLVRVCLARGEDGALLATPAGDQDTGILATQLRADAVAFVPPEVKQLRAGDLVQVQVVRPGLELEEP